MRTAPVLLAAILLTACQPQDPNGETAQPPADAPPAVEAPSNATDFGQPITARGNEPFWAVEMDGTKLTLKRPDQPDTAYEAPGGRIEPGKGEWQAKGPGGKTLTLRLFVSSCSDGMSDVKYPMTAEVELGTESLHGCAAPTAELPKGQ